MWVQVYVGSGPLVWERQDTARSWEQAITGTHS